MNNFIATLIIGATIVILILIIVVDYALYKKDQRACVQATAMTYTECMELIN